MAPTDYTLRLRPTASRTAARRAAAGAPEPTPSSLDRAQDHQSLRLQLPPDLPDHPHVVQMSPQQLPQHTTQHHQPLLPSHHCTPYLGPCIRSRTRAAVAPNTHPPQRLKTFSPELPHSQLPS
eukprot:scaffold26866_cov122-Isochrysis_galbana.AAC.1